MGTGRNLSCRGRQYRLDYFARKYRLPHDIAQRFLQAAGSNRNRANELAQEFKAGSMGQLRGETVLVVEDDYVQASHTEALLRSAGAEVVGPFQSEGLAFAEVLRTVPTAAILDIGLSGEPSFELARVLQLVDVPFIFVTGYERAFLPNDLSDAPHMLKPVTPEALIEELRRLP